MSPDETSSTSSGPPPNSRKERGAIAAQACETCRARKQKCDEQRPKCGVCQKGNYECVYREPLPTKKDKTLVELLALQKNVGAKVDVIYDLFINRSGPLPSSVGSVQPSPASQPSSSSSPFQTSSSLRPSLQPSSSSIGRAPPYRHVTAAHKVLTWDAIQRLLLQVAPSKLGNLGHLGDKGPKFLLWMNRDMPELPVDETLLDFPFRGMQSQASRATGAERSIFYALTPDRMHALATAYFDTFNFFYPFMDRQSFISESLLRVQTEGFNSDTDSVTALLVLALGELAFEGSRGTPVEQHKRHPSGLRGGSLSKPPGLALFNEARKRIGFTLTNCDLESVQIFSLAALYYASCSRYKDFWRLTVYASSACHMLITCNTIDWNTSRGDIIKRAFWHCAIMETALHLELDLPLSPIVSHEDNVGMPSFNSPLCVSDEVGDQYSHYREHYASQVALRRLCLNLNNCINDLSISSLTNNYTPATSTSDLGGLSASLLHQLSSQLGEWRCMLPPALQWGESQPASDPPQQEEDVGKYIQPYDPNLLPQPQKPTTTAPFFTKELERVPVQYPYAYDIHVALLRTKYYYAKYVSHRPFIYKALHFPEQMTQEDADGAAECLRACIRWPILLSPTCLQKRLIPYLFCWSQVFLGILLILHLSQHNAMLQNIRSKLCGPSFDADMEITVELMLDWVRDLKSTDPIALWCCEVLQGIYQMEV